MKLKLTKILFWLALVLSLTSFLLNQIGKTELYPFFYWRLYSQPLGSKSHFSVYRIYGVKNNDTIPIRNKGYEFLNQDDYYYYVNGEAHKILNYKEPKKIIKKRLFDFGKFLNPKFESYLLVQEDFSPLEINKDSTKFTKKIILESK